MPSDDIKTLFGRRVRQLRTALGVAQEAFAHRIGIDRSYFGSIERGRRNVSLEHIQRIADGLGVPPADLFRFDALTETGAGPNPPAPKAKSARKPNRHKPIP
jgi:transcriptional regulator with XRE-family HTH domain